MLPNDPLYPGNTAHLYDPDDPLIYNYIQRNTPEAFPFTANVFLAYLRSFLGAPDVTKLPEGNTIPGELDLLDSFYDPYRYFLVNRLLYQPLVPKFNEVGQHYIINYSRNRKDDKLFKMLVQYFFSDSEAMLVFGDSFRIAAVTTLDFQVYSTTDHGYTTDMSDDGTPRYICIITYPYEYSPGFSLDAFLEKVWMLVDLAVVVIPARVFFGIVLSPEFFYSFSKSRNLVDALDPIDDAYTDTGIITDTAVGGDVNVYGYIVVSSPFAHANELTAIKDMGDDEISRIYNSVEANSGAQVLITRNSKRVKSYVVSYWEPITYLKIHYSGTSSIFSDFSFIFPNQKDHPELYPQIMNLPVYYIRMTITFP